jgi:Flp pilus assembly pilin Flp
MLKTFLRDETGAELAEYAVGVALLVAIAVVVHEVLGDAIFDSNTDAAKAITDASYTR